IRHGFGRWPKGARYSRSHLKCTAGCRSQERAFRQRFCARLQRGLAKRWLQSHKPERRSALLLRRKFRGLELFSSGQSVIEPCADTDELYLHDLSFLMLEMIIN